MAALSVPIREPDFCGHRKRQGGYHPPSCGDALPLRLNEGFEPQGMDVREWSIVRQ
jgi:hypothetical protein